MLRRNLEENGRNILRSAMRVIGKSLNHNNFPVVFAITPNFDKEYSYETHIEYSMSYDSVVSGVEIYIRKKRQFCIQ